MKAKINSNSFASLAKFSQVLLYLLFDLFSRSLCVDNFGLFVFTPKKNFWFVCVCVKVFASVIRNRKMPPAEAANQNNDVESGINSERHNGRSRDKFK